MDGSMEAGVVFVFTGTSGSGRKTIAQQISKELGITSIVSYTTRAPRPQETDGSDYHFIARSDFIEADIRGEFFQTAEIDGNFYGLKREDINAALRQHGHVYVVVNRYAANKFKYEFRDRAVRLFIYANKQTIQERLEARKVPGHIISDYMNHYIEEVSYRKDCEHVFENLDLQHTIDQVKQTILAYIPAPTS
ncbi:guanylate kinase [Paenibacillus eucommiae]|uniref:Guanylate kinase n=1 Tax=Paenibacillus eucommiae TaxID=1355755 RepID=A0ABS4INB3_9BACL|nr:AAA family ATPase [Paenibacillus eucommiae]MBP1989000.1 guanylate kinase [Paenibacillus eucommiae]